MEADTMTVVKNLLELDMAAVEAYRLAIGASVMEDLKTQLRAFQSDHERHIRELSGWMRAQGEEPPTGLGERGETIRRYTELSSQEDRSAILAARGNEELTNSAYSSALRAELPEDLRKIVEAGFEDERRHISWIREAINLRAWDREPPELREALGEAKAA
jgi:rubrerythrin